jgi:hypothetical protein
MGWNCLTLTQLVVLIRFNVFHHLSCELFNHQCNFRVVLHEQVSSANFQLDDVKYDI